jgi:hypothetical protein
VDPNRLSPAQCSALINLGLGALPWNNRAFGRKRDCPSTWVSSVTARALARKGLVMISPSGRRLALTARGRTYAQALVANNPYDGPVYGAADLRSGAPTSDG